MGNSTGQSFFNKYVERKKKKTTKEKKKDEGFPIKRYYQTNAMYGPYLDLDSNNTTVKRHLSQTGKLQ